jgi:hypothetical protein
MPRPQALRRLPLREAIQSLKNGEGSTPFPAGVKSLSFRYLARNSEPGPR